VANESLALAQPGAALVMENIFPTQTGGRLRGGSQKYATVGSGLVQSLMVYRSGVSERMFASYNGGIYDVSAPVNVGIIPAPSVTGQTSDYYSTAQFATAGGEFMIAVNGTNLHQVFNGASWAQNTPAITGVSSATFSHVWSYRNRLFFVQKNTKTAWYLPVDSIGGAAQQFTLDGIFKDGGSLDFGATWSADGGDGLNTYCVFFSTTGEAAIYKGSNPSSLTDWAIVTLCEVTKPLGKNATMQAGPDLLIATAEGLIPLSEAMKKDPAALSLSAVSRNIEPIWNGNSTERSSRPWEIIKWPEKNMAIVSVPALFAPGLTDGRWGFGVWGTAVWGEGAANVLSQPAYCLVVNIQSGAWTIYTGWDVQCLAYFNGGVYFGTATGAVMQAEVGGNDNGKPYVCRYAGLFERLTGISHTKQLHLARATWTYGQEFTDKISFSTNYKTVWPTAPNAAAGNNSADVWDVGRWDQMKFDAQIGENIRAEWVSVGKSGYTVSPMAQVTVGGVSAPDAELVSIDLTYEEGGVVV
jgi:hypothetical protein